MGSKDKDHYNSHRRPYDKSESRDSRSKGAYEKDFKKNLLHKSNSHNNDSDKHNKYKDRRDDRQQNKNGQDGHYLKAGSKYHDKKHGHHSPRSHTSHSKEDYSKNSQWQEKGSYLGKRNMSNYDRDSRSGKFHHKDGSPIRYNIKKKNNHNGDYGRLIQWVKGEKLCMTRYFSKYDEPLGTLMTETEFIDVKDKILKDMVDRAKEAEMNNMIQFESM